MSDEKKKGDIFFAQVKGQPARLIRSTDPRLARKFVLAAIYPPEVEVRRPTTEEAMDMALDGVVIEDAMTDPTPPPSPTPPPQPDQQPQEPAGTIGGAEISGNDEPPLDLNDPVRMNPDDDAADHE
jgi:hypothetical protein